MGSKYVMLGWIARQVPMDRDEMVATLATVTHASLFGRNGV